MIRKIYITLIVLVATSVAALAQSGAIKGTVIDGKTKDPVPFANVVVSSNGAQVATGQTDFDGVYYIKPLNPGKYSVKVIILGFAPVELKGIPVAADKIQEANVTLQSSVKEIKELTIVEYQVPLISKDNTATGGTLTREEIAAAPTRSVANVAAITAGVSQADDNKGLNVRGGREEATQYIIDGVKVRGSFNVSQAGVEQITVYTGGVPAQFGDATSGIIAITTRGPSKNFSGGVEGVSSQLTDAYGYNLGNINFSGPIYSKVDASGNKNPVVGFFLNGEIQSDKDPNPSAIGSYKVKDDVLSRLQKDPLRPIIATNGTFNGTLRNAEFVTMNDLEKIKVRQDANEFQYKVNGRLDYKPTANTTFALGGRYEYDKVKLYDFLNSLFNSSNNRERILQTFAVYGRFTQKFTDPAKDANNKTSSTIKNAYYQIQADYSRVNQVVQDVNHKNDYFKYGYIGQFNSIINNNKVYEANTNGDTLTQTGYSRQSRYVYFTPGTANPNDTVYTSRAFEFNRKYSPNDTIRTLDQINFYGGLRNGDSPANVYSLYRNSGSVINGYNKVDNQQIRVTAMGSADIKNHAIQFGLEYEQRTDRGFGLAPVGLWTLMRRLTNTHLGVLDLTKKSERDSITPTGNTIHLIEYADLANLDNQNEFDKNVRTTLFGNASNRNIISIDNVDPSKLNLGMFSANELLNNGTELVNYYGYDYAGNTVDAKQDFDKFFTDFKNRPIGAFQPNYIAGYIQDKFSYKDLTFNIGVRVDRYDANQKVLKDKYSFYELKTAGDPTINSQIAGYVKPSNIGDDYAVYVDDYRDPKKVVGFRSGDDFFDAKGTRIFGTDVLKGGTSQINPLFVDKTDPEDRNILSTKYKTSVFKDYEAKFNVMPRVSFSFPISEDALFFAHYDVLTQRPNAGQSRIGMSDYLFIGTSVGATLANPDLKPSKTIDYELGYKQKLNATSALTITAFYREMRDMVNLVFVKNAFPVDYRTYGNRDFGTVKGMSLTYDLRRTNNIRINTSYTLQFADGTGSNVNSGANLNASDPELRTPIPLDFDVRHSIVASIDYRYDSGENYNGPIVAGKKILEKTGINFIFRANSGTPYSRQETASATATAALGSVKGSFLQGSINGSRLPWNFKTDVRIDRTFDLAFGKLGESKKNVNVNVYVLVQNLFDVRNVLNVYRFTGSADDDGYLSSANGIQDLSTISPSRASYYDLYSTRLLDPNNFSLPRRIRVGVVLNF